MFAKFCQWWRSFISFLVWYISDTVAWIRRGYAVTFRSIRLMGRWCHCLGKLKRMTMTRTRLPVSHSCLRLDKKTRAGHVIEVISWVAIHLKGSFDSPLEVVFCAHIDSHTKTGLMCRWSSLLRQVTPTPTNHSTRSGGDFAECLGCIAFLTVVPSPVSCFTEAPEQTGVGGGRFFRHFVQIQIHIFKG